MQHPSAALDDALEQKAAYIEGGATPETSSLGMQQSLQSLTPGPIALGQADRPTGLLQHTCQPDFMRFCWHLSAGLRAYLPLT